MHGDLWASVCCSVDSVQLSGDSGSWRSDRFRHWSGSGRILTWYAGDIADLGLCYFMTFINRDWVNSGVVNL
jgi:hypothetical protein